MYVCHNNYIICLLLYVNLLFSVLNTILRRHYLIMYVKLLL